jgi:hypothetical protein
MSEGTNTERWLRFYLYVVRHKLFTMISLSSRCFNNLWKTKIYRPLEFTSKYIFYILESYKIKVRFKNYLRKIFGLT